MNTTISNSFAITALQEGITVQGSLRINGTLSQNYNPITGNCVPDWLKTTSARPTIYPVVRKGISYMGNTQMVNTSWLYNDLAIAFDEATNKSTNFKDKEGNPLFERSTMTVSLDSSRVIVPCLKIISNLASPTNVDLDTIGFQGSIEIAGKQAAFAAQVDVRIAQMTTQGYLGLLSPESAIISEKGQTVEITATMYGADGEAVKSFFTKWFDAGTGLEISASRNSKTLVVREEDVVDNKVLRCDFYTEAKMTDGTRVASAFASVDDTQDPEFLYISLNGSDSDYSGMLSEGQSVKVSAWVATQADPGAINTKYTNFSVKLYDGNQQPIESGAPQMVTSQNKGTVTYPYSFVASNGYKINGIVTAS